MGTRIIQLVIVAFTLACGSFSARAADTYNVALHLFQNGKEIGSPNVVIKAGVPATVEVSGPGGYKLELTAVSDGPDRIKLSTQLDTSQGSVAPELIVRPGAAASFSASGIEIALIVTPHGS